MGEEAEYAGRCTVKSMTGYGRGTCSAYGLRVAVELSSVNRKQLDVNLSIPRPYAAYESTIQTEIRSKLDRGRVHGDISISYYGEAASGTVSVDHDLAKAYIKQLREAAGQLLIEDNMTSDMLLRLPGVVSVSTPNLDEEQVKNVLVKAVRKALRELILMRKEEGRHLCADLRKRFDVLETIAAQIKKEAPNVSRHYREQLQARLQDADVPVDLEDQRILKEIALFADRADITEEVTRLKSHFSKGRKMLSAAKPMGRSLDFLAQEIFRELNTIGSKANNALIAAAVVEAKTELERIREQVQNVE